MGKLADSIRDIVGIDKVKNDLKALQDKVEILARRGICYRDANGNLVTVTGNAGSSDNPVTAPTNAGGSSSSGGLNSYGSDSAQSGTSGQAAKTGTSNAGTGGTINGGDDGVYTIEELLDDLAAKVTDKLLRDNEVQTQSGTPFSPSNYNSMSPVVMGIDGWTDCETGLDGRINFQEGSYIPPIGSLTADDEIPDPTWDATTWWRSGHAVPGGLGYETFAEVIAAVQSYGGYYAITDNTDEDNINACGPPSPALGSSTIYAWLKNPSSGTMYVAAVLSVVAYPGGGGTSIVQGYPCGGSAELACANKLVEAPAATSWPLTGSFQLSPDSNGHFAGHPLDSEVPSMYQDSVREIKPVTTVKMCFGARTAELRPAINGGKILVETTGGAPTGTAQVFNSSMQLIAYVAVADMARYTP